MLNENNRMLEEEQSILDSLIREMDAEILRQDHMLTSAKLEEKKAKDKCLPDTYGMLVQSHDDRIRINSKIRELQQAEDELYQARIVVQIEDDDGTTDKDEIKIGLHTFMKGGRIYICSWKQPVCWHFYMSQDADSDFESIVTENEVTCHKMYHLLQNRKVTLHFTKVKNVTQIYPVMNEAAEVAITDEFLNDLLKRRQEKEFKNIVFSIQKQQREIIEAPYQKSLIIQGCAGSGKSMIMMHRLPLLLENNEVSKQRNSIYIITPSDAYADMMENMRYQLEIADLMMGTLRQYYEYSLEKYKYKPDVYGKKRATEPLSQEQEEYVYSVQCPEDIDDEIKKIVQVNENYEDEMTFFNLEPKKSEGVYPRERLAKYALETQEILNENIKGLRLYDSTFRKTYSAIVRLITSLAVRKKELINRITIEIKRESIKQEEINRRIAALSKKESAEDIAAYRSAVEELADTNIRLEELKHKMSTIANSDDYFANLQKKGTQLDELLDRYDTLKKTHENNNWEAVYYVLPAIECFLNEYDGIINGLADLEDMEVQHVDKVTDLLGIVEESLKPLRDPRIIHALSYERYQHILQVSKYFEEHLTNLPSKVYAIILQKMQIKQFVNRGMRSYPFSPYLFLQILQHFQGPPLSGRESLIAIDEAQNIAPTELKLISDLNVGRVIFNLFGDTGQHIEGTKGVDDWREFTDYENFLYYSMLENYRNARQVTNYCNQKFQMQMNAINLDGKGVHEFDRYDDFIHEVQRQFLNVQRGGICSIIAENEEEIAWLYNLFPEHQRKMHVITDEDDSIHRNQWNIMTVDAAKGLEFQTVIALSGRMTRNEKYITYTRALDELFIYDGIIELPEKEDETLIKPEPKENKKSVPDNHQDKEKKLKKEDDFTKSAVKKFFEDKGLRVRDERSEGGYLWVYGDKDEIYKYVNEATRKYGISGVFVTYKKSSMKNGWYTKSKK